MKVIYLMEITVKIELKGSEKIIKAIFEGGDIDLNFRYSDDELELDHDYDSFKVLKIDQNGNLTEVKLGSEMYLHYIHEPIPEEKVKEEIERLHTDLQASRTIGFWSNNSDCNPCFPYEITGYNIVRYINKPEEEQKKENLKALVILQEDKEAIIVMSDGGIAAPYHNEEHIILDLYQSRLVNEVSSLEEIWESLGEGKAYGEDFEQYDKINKEIIEYALNWLAVGFMGKERDRSELRIIQESDEKKIPGIINNFVFQGKYPRHKHYDIEDLEAVEYRKINMVMAVLINNEGDTEQILFEKGKINPTTSIINTGGNITDISISNDDEIVKLSKGKKLYTYKVNEETGLYTKKSNKYTTAQDNMRIFAFYPDYIETKVITLGQFTNSIQEQCTVVEVDLIKAQRDYAAKVRERKKLVTQKKSKVKIKRKMTKSLLRYLDDGKQNQVWLAKANEIDEIDGKIGNIQGEIKAAKIEEQNALKEVKRLKSGAKQCASFKTEKEKTEKRLGSSDWVVSSKGKTEKIGVIDPASAGFDISSMKMLNVIESQDWKILSEDKEYSIKINYRSKRVDLAIIYSVNRIDGWQYGCIYNLKNWTFFKLNHKSFDELISLQIINDINNDWLEKVGQNAEKTELISDWELDLQERLKNELVNLFKHNAKNDTYTYPGKKSITFSSSFDSKIMPILTDYIK